VGEGVPGAMNVKNKVAVTERERLDGAVQREVAITGEMAITGK
jgi:hypothetical protein